MTRINNENDFSWQVQYLVILECPRNVNDISWAGTVKHECRRFIVFCIPEVARRNVLDVSCVATIKRTGVG